MRPLKSITSELTLENEFKVAALIAEFNSCSNLEQMQSMAAAAIRYGILIEQNFRALVKEQIDENIS